MHGVAGHGQCLTERKRTVRKEEMMIRKTPPAIKILFWKNIGIVDLFPFPLPVQYIDQKLE